MRNIVFINRCSCIRLIIAICLLIKTTSFAQAQENSSYLYGPLGLNTVPNARMDKVGTIRIGTSHLDPYVHNFMGAQLAKPLYINIRQTFESSNILKDHERLYPGIDLKVRLVEETRSRPDISIGLQSVIGHKRTAGEYIAASKRYRNFDFTGGIGWGRLGSAAHFNNPLKGLFSHFGKARTFDDEQPQDPSDWFTGDTIGLFGGVEYFTPLKGLSLKLDYGADRYVAETSASDYNAPPPWSVGFNYQPQSWINAGVALHGNDKIMGRISMNTNIENWRDKHKRQESTTPLRKYRTGLALPEQMVLSAQRDNILLQDTNTTLHEATGRLKVSPALSSPHQLNRAAVHMSNHAGPAIEKLTIRPQILGLEGPGVSLLRKDLEKTAHHQGSSDEIWDSAIFSTNKSTVFKRVNRHREDLLKLKHYQFTLDNQMSLSEEDSGILYRNSLLVSSLTTKFFGLLDGGFGLRLNLHDNLLNIRKYRTLPPAPIRSDVDIFAQRTLALDNAYVALTHSFRTDLHVALIGGYLEEMYAGYGGEILYRPFKSRFAIGAEAWKAYKRDPFTNLNQGFTGASSLTAHINGYYDLPHYDLTLKAKIGRYLANDIGGELTLQKTFNNGAQLEGFVSYSDQKDFDVLGGSTHGHHGIRLKLPLGGYKYAPRNANIKLRAEPFAKDVGQSIASPLSLYDLTTPFSYNHLIQHWHRITPLSRNENTKTKKTAQKD